MALKLTSAPTEEPVTLADIKEHLRLDSNDEDSLLTSLIITAREFAESFQNRSYITQTWELWLDQWPDSGYISIPCPPLQSIASIKYFDPDNNEHTISSADYFVDDKSEPGRVVLDYGESWPSSRLRVVNGIVITFVAGYGDPSTVPKKVVQAMKLLIGYWYENREAAINGSVGKEIEFAVHALLWQDRVVGF